jgi:hypothetical protein
MPQERQQWNPARSQFRHISLHFSLVDVNRFFTIRTTRGVQPRRDVTASGVEQPRQKNFGATGATIVSL